MVEKQFQTNMFCVYITKSGCCFGRFNCNKESIANCWRSYKESTFAILTLDLGTKVFLETDDLKVLGVSVKCIDAWD